MKLHEMPVVEATVPFQMMKDTEAIYKWCNKYFEEGSWWYQGSNTSEITLEFDDDRNRMLFLLRWA